MHNGNAFRKCINWNFKQKEVITCEKYQRDFGKTADGQKNIRIAIFNKKIVSFGKNIKDVERKNVARYLLSEKKTQNLQKKLRTTFRKYFNISNQLTIMKVLITEKISQDAVELLKKEVEVIQKELTQEQLLAEIENYDGVLVRSKTKITKEVIEKGKNLKVIGRAGIGIDNIDKQSAIEKKIPIVFAPTGATISVAELTIGLMLSIARHIHKADKTTKEGKWLKSELEGYELYGKTLGFIGLGRIGYEVAKRAKAFGMNIIAYDPYIKEEKLKEIGGELTTIEEVLKNSDFITIHVPLTNETRGMISEKQFAIMRKGAYIINCARGGIIDEKALYNALINKKIRGACLDVFEKEPPINSPLLKLENIVFTPHLGASTHEGQQRAGTITVEQMLKVFRGEKPEFVANPEVYK